MKKYALNGFRVYTALASTQLQNLYDFKVYSASESTRL